MQTLLPANPLQNPKQTLYEKDLEAWVLDEAVAAYTGSGPSLQAAVEIYKRNVFLAVRAASDICCTELSTGTLPAHC